MKLKGIFNAGDIVKDIGEAIDRNITSAEERIKLYNELQQIIQSNVSARHAADMQSDSWLSRNVRPLTLLVLLLFYLLFATADALGYIHIETPYIDMLNDLLITAIAFYFGSRGVEKTTKILRK